MGIWVSELELCVWAWQNINKNITYPLPKNGIPTERNGSGLLPLHF